MKDEFDRPVLDYRAPERKRWPWRWIISLGFATGLGLVLSVSAQGIVFLAPVFGFAIAAASAAFAPKRKLAFGMLGCGVTACVCLLSASALNLWRGIPTHADELMAVVVGLTGLIAIPGLLGVASMRNVTIGKDR